MKTEITNLSRGYTTYM